MCSLCRIDIDGKALCAACFERLGKTSALASARTGYRHYNGIALHLSILGAIVFFLTPILGPLAIFTGLKGLKQSKALGEDLGTTSAKIAIGLGALETLAVTFAALALFGAVK